MSAIRIDEEISHVYLVLLQIESGCVFVITDHKYDLAIVIDCADVAAEFSAMTAVAWGCELDLANGPHILGDGVSGYPEGYMQIVPIDDGCSDNLKMYDRELRQRLRFRSPLIPNTRKSVIC